MEKFSRPVLHWTRRSVLRRRFTSVLSTTAAALVALGAIGMQTAVAGSSQAPVGLGTAASFAVLAGTTVTNTGSSTVSGNLGVNPGSAITGFPPGTVINGTQYTAGAVALQAQSDLTAAYGDAAGRTPTTAVVGDLGGQTLSPGVYKASSSLGLTGTVILDAYNNPNAVFIFEAGSTLTTAPNSTVQLVDGAQACNVFWQVGSSATLGSDSNFSGTILALTSASLQTGATVAGRVLARNGQVSLESNAITVPHCQATPPRTTPPPTTQPASTSISTTPSGSSIFLGQSISDVATVTGNATGGTPTGFVQFYQCALGTTSCAPNAGTALTPDVALVAGVARSPEVSPTVAGTYCFSAVYTPTGNTYAGSSEIGNSADDECFAVTASKVAPPPATPPTTKPPKPPVVVPSTHTGQPWAGWIYWAVVALAGAVGAALLINEALRRRVNRRAVG